MSKVGAAVDTLNLRPRPMRVRQPLYRAGDFIVETWPAAVSFKLVLGTVQFGAAAFADVGTLLPERIVFARKRHLGALVNYYLFFFRRELLKVGLLLRSRQKCHHLKYCPLNVKKSSKKQL